MATISQIETAIRNAQSANDTAAVGRLTALLENEKRAGAEQGGMAWGDVAYNAAKNVIPSAGKLVGAGRHLGRQRQGHSGQAHGQPAAL